MGAEHGHGHGLSPEQAASASGRYVRRMAVALAVLLAFLVLEAGVGFLSGSLSLLSDAAHMFTDVLGVGMALAAILVARRSSKLGNRTFGLYRMEVLAALGNAVLLFGVAGWILYEAVGRFLDPTPVPGLPVLLTAAAGLVANLVVFALLRSGAKESLNVRGAYLEVLADTVGSIGVLIGGGLLLLSPALWWVDPVIAVGVGAFVLPRTFNLGRQAMRILVQQAPARIDVAAVSAELVTLQGVAQAHDLHVWTLTSGMEVASVHVVAAPGHDRDEVLGTVRAHLAQSHGLDHVTVQIEGAQAQHECQHQVW